MPARLLRTDARTGGGEMISSFTPISSMTLYRSGSVTSYNFNGVYHSSTSRVCNVQHVKKIFLRPMKLAYILF